MVYGPIYVLLREEVSVRTAVLQGHAVASGAQAVSCHGQRAVVVCQSSILYHRHVPQKGVRLSLCLDSSTKVPREKVMITTTLFNLFFIFFSVIREKDTYGAQQQTQLYS